VTLQVVPHTLECGPASTLVYCLGQPAARHNERLTVVGVPLSRKFRFRDCAPSCLVLREEARENKLAHKLIILPQLARRPRRLDLGPLCTKQIGEVEVPKKHKGEYYRSKSSTTAHARRCLEAGRGLHPPAATNSLWVGRGRLPLAPRPHVLSTIRVARNVFPVLLHGNLFTENRFRASFSVDFV